MEISPNFLAIELTDSVRSTPSYLEGVFFFCPDDFLDFISDYFLNFFSFWVDEGCLNGSESCSLGVLGSF